MAEKPSSTAATEKKSKPMFPMPPNPGEVDQRPTWLKWVDNPLGETIKAINKVEDKVAQKRADRQKKKNAKDDDTVAMSVQDDVDAEKKQPLLNATLS